VIGDRVIGNQVIGYRSLITDHNSAYHTFSKFERLCKKVATFERYQLIEQLGNFSLLSMERLNRKISRPLNSLRDL